MCFIIFVAYVKTDKGSGSCLLFGLYSSWYKDTFFLFKHRRKIAQDDDDKLIDMII